jgi:DNA-binding transcriptional LysR family regulator
MISGSIRYFIAVAQFGSIREAAEHLNITQSAISRQIQKLEGEMHLRLLDRHARGISLTSAGEVLLHHANEAMQQEARLDADLEAIRGVKSGHVVVRAIESFASSRLPSILEQFYVRYPNVTLDVSVARTASIIEAVRGGQCHIGVTFCAPSERGIVTLASRAEPQLVILSPKHSLANEASIKLKHLVKFPIVGPPALGGSRQIFEAAWQAEGLTCRPIVETNSIHAMAGILRGGSAATIASRSRALPYIRTGELVGIPSTNPVLARGRIELLAREGQRLPPAADALARSIARSFSEEP